MCIKDFLTKNRIFCRTSAFFNTSKAHSDIKFGKELKTITAVDTSLKFFKSIKMVLLKNVRLKKRSFDIEFRVKEDDRADDLLGKGEKVDGSAEVGLVVRRGQILLKHRELRGCVGIDKMSVMPSLFITIVN